jgi:hypothetical protein
MAVTAATALQLPEREFTHPVARKIAAIRRPAIAKTVSCACSPCPRTPQPIKAA